MSLVVVVPSVDVIVMMADSSSGNMREMYRSPVPKIFQLGCFLIGFTGSWRVGQVVRGLDFGDPSGDLLAYMTGPFLDTLAAGLDRNLEALGKENTSTPDAEGCKMGGQLVVAVAGRIFIIQPDLAVLEADPVGCAIGGPCHFAYGALFAGAAQGLEGEPLALLALEAAARYSGLREPFVTLTLSSRPLRAAPELLPADLEADRRTL